MSKTSNYVLLEINVNGADISKPMEKISFWPSINVVHMMVTEARKLFCVWLQDQIIQVDLNSNEEQTGEEWCQNWMQNTPDSEITNICLYARNEQQFWFEFDRDKLRLEIIHIGAKNINFYNDARWQIVKIP